MLYKTEMHLEYNSAFLRRKIELFRSSTTAQRRNHFAYLAVSDGKFYFDGRRVCSTFFLKAFRFSRKLQLTVKQFDSSYFNSLPKHVLNDPNQGSAVLEQNFRNDSPAADSVVTFLERAVSETAEMMIETNECHLLFFHKLSVYEIFVKEFNHMYPSISGPAMSLLYRTLRFRFSRLATPIVIWTNPSVLQRQD